MVPEDSNPNWHIYRVFLERAHKDKIVIPVFMYGGTWYCLVITSNPIRKIQNNPSLAPCEVFMPLNLHRGALTHDSYLYIGKLLTGHIPVSEFADRQPDDIVHRSLRPVIIDAIRNCDDLPIRTQDLMLQVLEATR